MSKSICLQCWQHINEFHNFQKSVLEAQSKFEENLQQIVSDIKLESELDLGIESELQNHSTANENEIEDYEISLASLDIIDVKPEINWPTDESDSKDEIFTKELKKDEIKRPRKSIRRKTNIKEKKNFTCKESNNEKCPLASKTIEPKYQLQEQTENINNSSNLSPTNIDDNNYASDNDSVLAEENTNNSNQNVQNHTKTKAKRNEFDTFIAEWKQDLECELCHESYQNFTLLRKHFITKHPQQKCYISCCQRKLTHRVQIVEHIRYHMDSNSFKCTICEKIFPHSRNLKTHIRDQHTTESKERPYECTLCQKRFFKKGALKSHMDTHDSATDYKCNECGKGFPSEQRRKIHERSVHNVDRICEQCGKTVRGIAADRKSVV